VSTTDLTHGDPTKLVKPRADISQALAQFPQGLFVLTARFEDRRLGMLASWVQQAGLEPPMVSVAVAKGRQIMPLISESRQFGICQVPAGDKMLIRRFAGNLAPGEDPFLGLTLLPGQMTGLPILAEALSYLECAVTCHVDVEGDHDIFVGAVRAGQFLKGEPMLHRRENGLKY
jgi:flavin reductase (DIM6/NTAB) family NADH-FMN oxidoreductase RutF